MFVFRLTLSFYIFLQNHSQSKKLEYLFGAKNKQQTFQGEEQDKYRTELKIIVH